MDHFSRCLSAFVLSSAVGFVSVAWAADSGGGGFNAANYGFKSGGGGFDRAAPAGGGGFDIQVATGTVETASTKSRAQ